MGAWASCFFPPSQRRWMIFDCLTWLFRGAKTEKGEKKNTTGGKKGYTSKTKERKANNQWISMRQSNKQYLLPKRTTNHVQGIKASNYSKKNVCTHVFYDVLCNTNNVNDENCPEETSGQRISSFQTSSSHQRLVSAISGISPSPRRPPPQTSSSHQSREDPWAWRPQAALAARSVGKAINQKGKPSFSVDSKANRCKWYRVDDGRCWWRVESGWVWNGLRRSEVLFLTDFIPRWWWCL